MVYGHPNFSCLIYLSLYFLTHTNAYQNTSGLPCLPRLIILYSYQRIPKYYGSAWDFANLPPPQLSKQVITFLSVQFNLKAFFIRVMLVLVLRSLHSQLLYYFKVMNVYIPLISCKSPPLFIAEFGDSSKIYFKGKYKILRYHTNSSAPFV